jgi:integrase
VQPKHEFDYQQLLDDYTLHCRIARGLGASSITQYSESLRLFRLTADDFNSPRLYAIAARQFRPGLSPASMRTHLRRLATFSRYLAQIGVTRSHTPLRSKQDRPKPRPVPTADDIARLLDFLKTQVDQVPITRRRTYRNHWLIVRVLLETGCRITEALTLHTDALLLDRQPPAIHYCAPHGHKPALTYRGKTISAERVQKISPALAADLKHHLDHQFTDLVFTSHSQKPYSKEAFDGIMRRLNARLHLSCHTTPHSLRYLYIMTRAAQGASIFQVMTEIGHAHPRQTIHYFNRARRLMPGATPNSDLCYLIDPR